LNRGTLDILNEERAVLENAINQGNQISPELYRALGLEPIYGSDAPDLAGLRQSRDDLRGRENALMAERDQLKGKKGGGKQKRLQQIKKELHAVKRQAQDAEKALGEGLTAGRTIIGFDRIAGVADPTGSAGGGFGAALDEFGAHRAAALAGKEPVDPTLLRAFDEKERALRENLRRQLGTDYENSTAGQQALANLSRERAEAVALYNTDRITTFSALEESRAGALSELTSARLKQLMSPALFTASLGESLEGLTAARDRHSELMQRERQVATEQRQNAERENAKTQSGGASSLLGNLLGGVGAASSSLGGMASQQGWSASGLARYLGGTGDGATGGGTGPDMPGLLSR
jgi:hypothetical protein